jgi:hypothetical protein
MAKREKLYRRLPGRSRHWMGYTTLWLGPDHLLLVDGRGYSEIYRRFYYRDIASIVTRGTGTAGVWSAILGLLLLGVAAAAAFTVPDGRAWWAIPGAPLLLFLVVNIARGASCVAHITTPIQTAPLPLRRWRAARRALSLVRERVAEVQRPLDASPEQDGALPASERLETP